MLIKTKFEGYSPSGERVLPILDIFGRGGGGTSTTTTGPEQWVTDIAKDIAGRATTLTDINTNPYVQFPGERVAPFSKLQEDAFKAAGSLTPSQLGEQAGQMAGAATMGALNTRYQPGYFANQFQAPGEYRPGFFGVQGVTAPQLQQYQMGPAERVSGGEYTAPMMATAQTEFRPDLQTFQMGPAERARTQSFVRPGTAEAYMSPFMESVIGRQTREAERQAGLAARQRRAQAIQQGAFGGTRGAITEAAAARDLEQLKSDIYGAGQQAAFQQAQQQFNQEQQARLQAQLANQQAGLTVGGQNLAAALGVQQLGTQTGLQTALANLSAQQQANVQNQAAQLQAQGLTANQAMQAALANQQAGLTTGQQNLAALLGTQQLGAGQNLQAQLANQAAAQQAQAQREASRQFGYGQRMQAAGLGAQYGQAAQQLAEQSRQYGAGLGMQGLQTALTGAGQMGALGGQQFGQAKDVIGLQFGLGKEQQQLGQRLYDVDYQNFLSAERYPYQQLEFMSNIMRGIPMGTVQNLYTPPPTGIQNLTSLGLGAYGLNQLFRKEGGTVKEYARGGSVTSDYFVEDALDKLSRTQLDQAERIAAQREDEKRLMQIAEEKATRASESRGFAGMYNALPQGFQRQMAGGGIVAFAGDEDDNDEETGQLVSGDDGYVQTPGGLYVLGSEVEGDDDFAVPSPGNPEMHRAAALRALRAGQQIGRFQPTIMTPEQERQFVRDQFALEQGLAGPNEAAKAMRAYFAQADQERAEGLRQAKGIGALKAAGAVLQPGGLMRGLGAAGSAFAESYDKALQADRAEKRALKMAEFNLMDAERKERMGQAKSATAALAARRQNLQRADKLHLDKLNYQQQGAAAVARATRPAAQPKPAAPRAPKEFEVAVSTYLPEVQALYPELSPARQRAKAFQLYQERKSAGLAGVTTRTESTAEENARTRAAKRYTTDPQLNEALRKKDAAAASRRREEILAEERRAAPGVIKLD